MKKFDRFVIAIDGPSATGKTTMARALCDELGFDLLLTGKIYRAYAKMLIDANIDVNNIAAVLQLIKTFKLSDLERDLSSEEIAKVASIISSIPEVRQEANQYQLDFIRDYKYVVLEGRDIGTVICPDAELKIYLTANATTRAKRRFDESDGSLEFENLLQNIIERDNRDSVRQTAPLKPADDAVIIDNSNLTPNDQLQLVLNLLPKEIYNKTTGIL